MEKFIITLTFAAATIVYANAQTPAKKENRKAANPVAQTASTTKPAAVEVTDVTEKNADKKGCSTEEKKACGTEEKSKKACCSSKKAETAPNP
jgi:hypothetical protein